MMAKGLKWLIAFGLLLAALTPIHAQEACDSHTNYYSKIHAFIEQQLYDQAIDAANCALEFNAHEPYLLVERGFAYFLNAQYDEAIADLSEAEGITPQNPRVHYYWGVALFQAGSYDEALDHLTATLELSPDEKGADFFLNNAYAYRGYTYMAQE